MAKHNHINQPPAWTNQPITLYHGTTLDAAREIEKHVDLKVGRSNCDFGQGFYTTTVLQQAKSWAYALWIRKGSPIAAPPAVVAFTIERDDLARLRSIWFTLGDRAADDYWSLVWHCRGGGGHYPGSRVKYYDVVAGPVASQWRSRQTVHDSDQVCFHTPDSVKLLNGNGRIIWELK